MRVILFFQMSFMEKLIYDGGDVDNLNLCIFETCVTGSFMEALILLSLFISAKYFCFCFSTFSTPFLVHSSVSIFSSLVWLHRTVVAAIPPTGTCQAAFII